MIADIPCVILVGGLGTRLGSIVNDIPKPMVQVAGHPFLAYLIEQVRAAGCKTIILCIGHQGQIIEEYFGDGHEYGLRILYSREEQLRGTAGALAQARQLLRATPFFVLNGDSYCPLDFQALLAHHRVRGAQATIGAAQVSDASPYGRLILAPDDAVLHFQEKSIQVGPSYVNAGIYLLEPAMLELIPKDKPYSLERELFPQLTGGGLYAFRQAAPFVDVGTPASLAAAQVALPKLLQRGTYETF